MDILSLSPDDYRALATFLDGRAAAIDAVMPPVVSATTSTAFEGKFATRAKRDLRECQQDAEAGADAVRAAARVARQRAADLETEQAAEVARRAAAALEALRKKAQELFGGD